MRYSVDDHGKLILRLHYEADPDKAQGERIHVADLGMDLTPWAFKEYSGMTNKALYRQEYEVDGSATSGARIYPSFDREASVVDSFPIPPTWTRRMSLDPHPSVPHAFLWCATDPRGDRWYYRELWPSKVSFRYEGKMRVGEAGPCPGEDNRFAIRDYVQTVRYLESAENPENQDSSGHCFHEHIHARVIDYTARAWAAETREGQLQVTYQQAYELHMSGRCKAEGLCEKACPPVCRPWFDDAKKDHSVGEEMVNSGLRPFLIESLTQGSEKLVKSARIHIFGDRCPELIYELENGRRQQLTPLQVDRMDPTGKPVEVRLHEADNCRYIEMSSPTYIDPKPQSRDWTPPVQGIGY